MLLDKSLYENNLIYNILCKALIVEKSLRIIFDKIEWFIRDFDGI